MADLPPVKQHSLSGKTIIISGEVEDYDRKTAQKILENAGATFAKSLNKSVNLVVLGGNAGPAKLEKIKKMGIETKEWDEIMKEIEGDGKAGVVEEDEEVDEEELKEEEEDEDEEMEEEEVVEEKPKKGAKGKKAAPAAANTKAKAKPKAPAKVKSEKPSASSSSSAFTIKDKTVLVTGTIAGHTRATASSVLEKQGATVAKSLNKTVELVILGVNPGPDKLSKIESLEIPTISWSEFAQQAGLDYDGADEDADNDAPEPQTLTSAPDSVDGKMLLITGTIEGHTRSSAQKVLEAAGAKFAKSLNASVELVVLGANPGPDKLGKINELGIPTVEWEDLTKTLGVDAGGSEPPAKKARKK